MTKQITQMPKPPLRSGFATGVCGVRHTMNRITPVILSLLLLPLGVLSQERDMAEFERMIAEIQKSHIEANVPPQSEFEAFLIRDLESYFGSIEEAVDINYELLRDGPTQSGVAYPKYYLWAEIRSGKQIIKQGAVLVAAIEKKRFEVYEFLSKLEIQKNPDNAAKVFPRMLLDRIYELAKVQ